MKYMLTCEMTEPPRLLKVGLERPEVRGAKAVLANVA